MNVLKPALCLLLVLGGFLSSYNSFADQIDEQRALQPGGLIKIKALRGEIKVEGWSNDQIRVQGELDDLATGLRFEVRNDRAEIEIEMPRGNINWGDGSDLLIQVPMKSRISIESVSSDLFAEGLHSGAQIRTISGEIELSDVHEKVMVNTVSGEIRAESTSGDLRASSSSGSIFVKVHSGNIDVETTSGEIEVIDAQTKQLRTSSMSGEIDLEATMLSEAFAEVKSVSGAVTVKIRQPNNMTIMVNTTSGRIDNDITDDPVEKDYGRRSLEAVIGDGTSRLNIRTVSGRIELDEG